MNLADFSVDDLARRCAEDTEKFHHRQTVAPQFCYELLRRALAEGIPDAFTNVYRIYEPQVLRWARGHSRFAQTGETPEFFVSAAFSSFYFSLRGDKFERFAQLAQALAYLKLCVHTAIALYLRDQERVSALSLDDQADTLGYQPDFDAPGSLGSIWAHICTLLPDERDQVLADCVFVRDMKPAEIARQYARYWKSPREVSVALQRIRRNLRSDATLRSWMGIPVQEA